MIKEVVFDTCGYTSDLTDDEISDNTKALIRKVLETQLPDIPEALKQFIEQRKQFAIAEKGYKPEEVSEKVVYRVRYIDKTRFGIRRKVGVQTPHWFSEDSVDDDILHTNFAYSAERNALGQQLANSVAVDISHLTDEKEARNAEQKIQECERMKKRISELERHLEALIKASNEPTLVKAGLVKPQTQEYDEEELTNEQQEALETAGLDC